MSKLIIATRKSPLALAQTVKVGEHLGSALNVEVEQLRIVTTGDQQTQWSLEKRGGKGLFTSELEQALLRGEADIAVHSTKDLPGEMAEGLAIAGYMPRADARDMLVRRVGITAPATVATGSPRRRLQLSALHAGITFSEIRGNVDTRLRKIAQDKVADATMLAAAGLARLGISDWEGLEFVPLSFDQMVPAVGQAAIAIQCRAADAARYAAHFDLATARAVAVERAFQTALGGGCHTAFAAHATAERLYLFHEDCGRKSFPLTAADFDAPQATATRILAELGLKKA
jgi:hydroxymethylbilane synthase